MNRYPVGHWRTLFEQVPTALLVLDSAGFVLAANAAAQALYGLAGERITGQHLLFLGAQDDATEHDPPWPD